MALRGAGSVHREPCAKCNLPVFIAERLNVGKLLFHRTCFRCARCSNQLTLSNYYETENNEYCCETCPDEEVSIKEEQLPDDKLVWSRSLSDEEKSANLKNDDYSTQFETALENFNENSKARSDFVQSQLVEWESDEEPPDLPSTKPPDLNSEQCDDSGFPIKEQIVNSVSDNQLETASVQLENSQDDVVTKEESRTENSSQSVVTVDDSIVTISDTSNSKQDTNPFEYPDDLNPFGSDDDDDETSKHPVPVIRQSKVESDYDSSLNPFGSEDDEEQPSPRPRAKKKIKPPAEDKEIPPSPFNDDDDDEEEAKQSSPIQKKKVIPAPRITLTPFWNDEPQSLTEKPVPLPRLLKYVTKFSFYYFYD